MKRTFVLAALLLSATAAWAAGDFSLRSANEVSRRTAYLLDDGKVGSLYITVPGKQSIEQDAFVYSRVPPSPDSELILALQNRNSPLLSVQNASDRAVMEDVRQEDFSFEWSKDGTAVAVLRHDEPLALISTATRESFSKAIAKESMTTKPWNEDLYVKLFDPYGRDTLLRKAIAFHDRGDPGKALSVYEKLLAANGADGEVLFEASLSAHAAGKFADCLSYAQRSLGIQTSHAAGLHSLLGGCNDGLGHGDEALAAFEKGLKLDPANASLNLNYGVMLLRKGDRNAARERLKVAIGTAQWYAPPYLVYAQILDQEGNAGAALAMYARYLMLDPVSPRGAEAAARILELLKSSAPLTLADSDRADTQAGRALESAYSQGKAQWASAQKAKETEAEHAVKALRAFFQSAVRRPGEELKSAFLWKAALGPAQEFTNAGILDSFLYVIATKSQLPGAAEWSQAHPEDALRLLRVLMSTHRQAAVVAHQ
jgi:tetratricopeptide (TPR) repeat protein